MNCKQISMITVLLIISLCCSTPTETSLDRTHPIVGSWDWIVSAGGEGGLRTPHSEGFRRIYRFEKHSIFSEFRNDTLILQTSYRIVRDRIGPFMPDSSDVLFVNGWTVKWAIEFSGTDTLILNALSFDIGYEKFVRRK
jgi:hypothetical protein